MNTATPILIRPLRADEAPALRALFHAAVHGLACRDYTPAQLNAWAPLAHDAAQWAARLQANQPWVAEVAGSAAGFADLQPDGTIDQFFVDAAYAGQGVGSALLAFLLGQAKARGLRQVRSHVSLTAQPLFMRHGFAVVQRQTVQLRGMAFENAVMACELRP